MGLDWGLMIIHRIHTCNTNDRCWMDCNPTDNQPHGNFVSCLKGPLAKWHVWTYICEKRVSAFHGRSNKSLSHNLYIEGTIFFCQCLIFESGITFCPQLKTSNSDNS